MINTLEASVLVLWVVVIVNLLLTLALIRRANVALPSLHQPFRNGDQVPPFTAMTLDGRSRSLADFADTSTVFLFVSPGCVPCKEAMPQYLEMSDRAREQGVSIVMVSDGGTDDTMRMIEEFRITNQVLLAPRAENDWLHSWRIEGTPMFVHLERGRVRGSGVTNQNVASWYTLARKLGAPGLTGAPN